MGCTVFKTVESHLLKSVAKEEEVNLKVIKPNHMSLLHFCTRVKYTGPLRTVGEMSNHNLIILYFLHRRSKSCVPLKILLETKKQIARRNEDTLKTYFILIKIMCFIKFFTYDIWSCEICYQSKMLTNQHFCFSL